MKILQLRFKNLNSLQGEWLIDFSDPEYISGGIFALTGPTGAGKSTILDAICLALYGATPRLGKITQSNNEIMSRHTGECFAEVIFEAQAGTFRCHWSQHRANKKATGKLADAKQEISEFLTGHVLEGKKSLVSNVVEEKTGMDFERFTRSILLAQGGFDTFLKANAEQKSKILEQITGTEIYSKISSSVFDRNKEENTTLTTLQAETSGIRTLEPEQQQQIQLNIKLQQKQESALVVEQKNNEQAVNWLNGINELKVELNTLTQTEKQLFIEIEKFKPQQQQLHLAYIAAEFAGDYALLKNTRQQQQDDKTALQNQQNFLPQLEKTFSQQAENLKHSEQQRIQTKQKQAEASPLLKQVRALDQKLEQQKQSIYELKTNYQLDVTRVKSNKEQQLALVKQQEENTQQLNTIQLYLQQNATDVYLVSDFSGIEQQLNQLLLKQKDISKQEQNKKESENSLQQFIEKFDKATLHVNQQQQQLEKIKLSHEQANSELANILDGKLLGEYQAKKESLLTEKLLRATIANLEEQRNLLTDGSVCPLCGALEHPYAKGNIPLLDETEKSIQAITTLINKAQQQEHVIQQIIEQKNQAQSLLAETKNLCIIAENEKQSAQQRLTQLAHDLQTAQSEFTTASNDLSALLQPLGIEFKHNEKVDVLIKSLQQRLQKWHQYQQQKTELEKNLASFESEIKHISSMIQSQEIELIEKNKNLVSIKNEYQLNQKLRLQLFADKNTDDEETRLNKAISDAELKEKQTRANFDEAKQQLLNTQTIVSALTQDVEKRATELAQLEDIFTQTLVSKNFIDEQHLLACMLSTENKQQLELKAKQLDTSQTELATKIKDRQVRLDTELAKKMSDKPLEQLQTRLVEGELKLKQLREQISAANHQLKENLQNKEIIKEKQVAIDAQKKECQRWGKLSDLIGSADGKKYRNFAQGLTFELMVTHANQQLAKMSDRYLLIRDKKGLELNVIDNYQAGETRSCKNLSGGESFIVSLTLALGLSKMASQKVRVDSLFLDEGFGTLDEDTLETALETLAGLQQDGKLIGVISHVSALKERIRTQINISPISGGKSSISGPGCSKV